MAQKGGQGPIPDFPVRWKRSFADGAAAARCDPRCDRSMADRYDRRSPRRRVSIPAAGGGNAMKDDRRRPQSVLITVDNGRERVMKRMSFALIVVLALVAGSAAAQQRAGG